MRTDPEWQDDANPNRPPVLKIAGRFVVGWLAGSLISLSYSQYFAWFLSIDTASTPKLWGVAIGAVLFAAAGALAGATAYRPQALNIGAAIAATIAAVNVWSWFATPQRSHWAEAVAVFLMAPAAQFAALTRRED